MTAVLDLISDLVDRHATGPVSGCALDRVTLVRAQEPGDARSEMFTPVVCLVTRGAKEVQLGDRSFTFTTGQFVASALQVPITGRITHTPYRAAAVHLHPDLVADLLLDVDVPFDVERPTGDQVADFTVGEATPEMVDAYHRYLRLLDHATDRAALAAGAEREVLYRALRSPLGAVVRQFALTADAGSPVQALVRAIREDPTAHLNAHQLAARASMSVASLYRHFRVRTGTTPLQLQKQLRLQEARKMLLLGDITTAGAARAVGYRSPGHFSRDYGRQFGSPPGADRANG